MTQVRSSKGLTEDLLKAGVAPAPKAAVAAEGLGIAPESRPVPGPIAVVGVHGISPIQQYGFQDQLATGLLSYLNAVEAATMSGRTWLSSTYWPQVSKHPKNPVLKPSALRLHRDDQDPEKPAGRVYDVYEGYWSPFSKGKTNIASLLTWLLRITFLATSSTANVPASWRKLKWDIGYLVGALVLVAACLAGAVVTGAIAWTHFVALVDPHAPTTGSFFDVAFNPLQQIQLLPWTGWLQLVFDVVIAYLIVQLVVVANARRQTSARTAELSADSSDTGHFTQQTIAAGAFHRAATVLFVALVLVLAIIDGVILRQYHPDTMWRIMWHGVWLVAAIGLLQTARGIADFVVEDVLGDVQVYCTHDCNSSFFAVRQQIMDAVTKAVLGAVKAVGRTTAAAADDDLPPLYDKIHIAAHSLGTTVALDVLMRVRQFVEEGSVDEEEWKRIRSFTTFGTALEKTRFLLDVRNPTVSAAQQQWQNDAYGRFFTLERSTLEHPFNDRGIFWSNHWYFNDIVANEIVSYKSDVRPGASFKWTDAANDHPICEDNLIANGRPFWVFVHGDYLGDPLFWKNAGPVFTS